MHLIALQDRPLLAQTNENHGKGVKQGQAQDHQRRENRKHGVFLGIDVARHDRYRPQKITEQEASRVAQENASSDIELKESEGASDYGTQEQGDEKLPLDHH